MPDWNMPPPDWDNGDPWADDAPPGGPPAAAPPAPRAVSETPPAYAYAGAGALAGAADSAGDLDDDDNGDDDWDAAEPAAEEETMTLPDRAAIEEAQEPPPAPVVEMPATATEDGRRATDDGQGPTAGSRPPAEESGPLANRPPVANGSAANGPRAVAPPVAPPPVDDGLPAPSRVLVVEVKASGNWKETCRQSLRLAERYEGNAGLRLQLAGQDLAMDFPNRRIECAVDLVEALERLPGVGRVYER